MSPSDGLRAALDELELAVRGTVIVVNDAVAEGRALSAALSETASGAKPEWAAACGVAGSEFSQYAARGRVWRNRATPILHQLVAQRSSAAGSYAQALALVASAACSLGEPMLSAIHAASMSAAAQLRAAGIETDPRVPRMTSSPSGSVAQSPKPEASQSDGSKAVEAPPVEPHEEALPDLATLLAQLDALVGLVAVKAEIHRQAELLRVAQLRATSGLKTPPMSRHLVFTGNPGTGKTTVARLVSGIYRALGVLEQGQLIECDRSELVAGYVGQTAIKTAEVAASAVGGVLFIDEAYALASDDFGKEAVDTLVKEMEDHRDELVVIVAGYPAPMQTFIETNPGLESRFGLTIHFADYTDDELVAIFTRIVAENDFDAAEETVEAFRQVLADQERGSGFGNGRFARNCFEQAVGRQAWRLRDNAAPSIDELRCIMPHDIRPAEANVVHDPNAVNDPESDVPQ